MSINDRSAGPRSHEDFEPFDPRDILHGITAITEIHGWKVHEFIGCGLTSCFFFGDSHNVKKDRGRERERSNKRAMALLACVQGWVKITIFDLDLQDHH